MSTSPRLSNARTELWLPRLSLSACIRGAMLRDTRGVALEPEQRFNYYPATPLCSISWYLEGEIDTLKSGHTPAPDAPRRPLVARITFSGPQTRPVVTWNRGPAHGMMLLLLPDAMHLLTGLEPREWLDRTVDAAEVLPEPWLAMCHRVLEAADDATRTDLIEHFLDPLWQARRPAQTRDAQRYADWVQGLALRAATSRTGRSLRQIERRILQWAGQPIRELRGFGRAERAFFDLMSTGEGDAADWAGLALDNDYSDQSHLCRTSRRMTGFAPAALRERIARDEGFWPYRIWQ